jgi:hypothetical protein
MDAYVDALVPYGVLVLARDAPEQRVALSRLFFLSRS